MNNGFTPLVLLIGLFAIAEVMVYAEPVREPKIFTINEYKIKGVGFSLKEFISQIPNAI